LPTISAYTAVDIKRIDIWQSTNGTVGVKGRRMSKVLIAENDLLLADMLEEDLLHAGYEVCGIARTVEEGIALGSRHDPDLALLDLRLASGGLGTEIAAQLDREGGLGILYATGNSEQIHLTRADGDGIGPCRRRTDLEQLPSCVSGGLGDN
jgi:CheY-like chemotaxis protein